MDVDVDNNLTVYRARIEALQHRAKTAVEGIQPKLDFEILNQDERETITFRLGEVYFYPVTSWIETNNGPLPLRAWDLVRFIRGSLEGPGSIHEKPINQDPIVGDDVAICDAIAENVRLYVRDRLYTPVKTINVTEICGNS